MSYSSIAIWGIEPGFRGPYMWQEYTESSAKCRPTLISYHILRKNEERYGSLFQAPSQ